MSDEQRKFTDEQEIAIAEEYIGGGTTFRKLAEKYGCSLSTIHMIMRRTRVLDEMERRADTRARMALINIKNASADAAEKLIALTKKKRSDKAVYADIQLIGQVLDRAGVRAAKEENKDVTVTFRDGGIRLGETEDVKVSDS